MLLKADEQTNVFKEISGSVFKLSLVPDGRTQKQGPSLGSSRLDRSAGTGVQHGVKVRNIT